MNNDELKSFLKNQVSEVPPAPLGEGAAIWNKIEDRKSKNRMWFWAFIPLVTASVFVLISIQQTRQLQKADEDFLYQEWTEFAHDVDSDGDLDMVVLGK